LTVSAADTLIGDVTPVHDVTLCLVVLNVLSYSPGGVSMAPYQPMHGSLSPHESVLQTAYQLVQPFLHCPLITCWHQCSHQTNTWFLEPIWSVQLFLQGCLKPFWLP